MPRIDAVTVVEFSEGTVISCQSFPDTQDGRNEAENRFRDCVKENYPETSPCDIDVCIADGVFDANTYSVYIVYSCE